MAQARTFLSEYSAQVSELESELVLMRALEQGLRARVARLEAAVARRRHTAAHAAEAPAPVRALSFPVRAPAAAPSARAPADAVVPANLVQANAAQVVPTQASAQAPVEIAVTALAAPKLAMPPHNDVVSCVRQLLGSDIKLGQDRSPYPKDLKHFFVGVLVDASEQPVGALLSDGRATAELGGQLLGLPAAAIKEQLSAGPSEDALEGMNEVANNLGGIVNRANPSCHVRIRALLPFNPDGDAWLLHPAKWSALSTPAQGRLLLVSR